MDSELVDAIAEQQREIMEAEDLESDLDFAFRLQLQEALRASLAGVASSSRTPSPPLPPDGDEEFSSLIKIQSLEFKRFQQEKKDQELCQAEMRRAAYDLKCCYHDAKLARDIIRMPDDDWNEFGDNFERPIDEGCSSGPALDQPFRLYFKGLVAEVRVTGVAAHLAAIGAAICDPQDNLVLKIQKPLTGGPMNHEVVEAQALIEGLTAMLYLDSKRVDVFFDYVPLYNHVTRTWAVRQRKIANLIDQVISVLKNFEACRLFLKPRCHVKFAFELARGAIDSQITKPMEGVGNRSLMVTCTICLEETDQSQMFVVGGCSHSYCFSCMKQHVVVQLLHGVLPGCPHENCTAKLNVEGSKQFLPEKLLETLSHRIKEASIPEGDRIYCPYPKCSYLMSKSEMIRYQTGSSFGHQMKGNSGLRRCIKCSGNFCINCKAPWHYNLTCHDYRRLHPQSADGRLQSLAKQQLWRQCVKCNHMIELAEGCYHMTCRCGYEFCYLCGAEWRNKKATCKCPLWDERNILHHYVHDGLEGVYEDEDDDDEVDGNEDWY